MKKNTYPTNTIDVIIAPSPNPIQRYRVVDGLGNDDQVERVTSEKRWFPDVSWRFHNKTQATLEVEVQFGATQPCPVDFRGGGVSCSGFVRNLKPGETLPLHGRVNGEPGRYNYQIIVRDGAGQYVIDPELQIDDRGKRGLIAGAFVAGVVVGFTAAVILL